MLTDHRHEEILTQLTQTGRVGVASIAATLQVSDETIRRDLKLLEERGLLRRIHGGAVQPRLDQERPLVERSQLNGREKGRVGILGETLVRDGMSIFIDTGTTTLAFARRLTARKVTVTTNSIDIALLLADTPVRVNLTPGRLRPKDNALVGYDTVDYARRHFFDLAVMGIAACDAAQGWMDYEEHESVLRRVLKGQTRRPVLLADASKFGRQANLQTFDLATPLTIVTERAPPEPFAELLARHDIDLVCT